ncbi:MAG: riboflavin biosynthesis protein RibD [Flavobacteriaceae bacterium]|nr:riboflavin biosynthesis protein RibD [Flavobacteriaceae bacterium]|tara:strand:+ start:22826 stop:23860 length:1035 start_codon:yes stop_codon:yes gene_type:complete
MIDEFYMKRCLFLAKKGIGYTSPNPMVGCVIVHKNEIIGEGWHKRYGSSHAELNAIKSVENTSLLSKSIIYVNLEPCNHYGKTPPCSELIIKYKIPKIVIGVKDPNNKVDGKGIEKLKKHGCEIKINVLKKDCINLNKRFFTFCEKKRPYVILKWARTKDGFIAPLYERNKSGKIYWISNSLSIQRSHKLRSIEDGILVGVNTIINDNPSLTLRKWNGKSPRRYIIDPNLKINNKTKVMKDKYPLTIINSHKNLTIKNKKWIKCDFTKTSNILEILYKENIQSVIIEGGSKTIQYFIDENLWDEARVFTGEKKFFEGIREPKLDAKEIYQEKIGNNKLNIYHPI